MPPTRLFAYGSLRSDAQDLATGGEEARRVLSSGAALEGPASISGRLYRVDWYPALVPGHGVRVRGEVWRIADPAILDALDAYEGEAYVREPYPVHMDDGRRVTAFVYRYTASLEGVPEIASGDYLSETTRAGRRT